MLGCRAHKPSHCPDVPGESTAEVILSLKIKLCEQTLALITETPNNALYGRLILNEGTH